MPVAISRLLICCAIQVLIAGTALSAFDLAGEWQLAAGGEQWPPQAMPAEGLEWAPVAVPNPYWHHPDQDHDREALAEHGWVWLRRHIDLDAEQAERDAALVYESIRWGFRAWVNGEAVGGDELYAPGSMPIESRRWRTGPNELLLAVRTYRALPRGGRTEFFPLMPVGSARMGWGHDEAAIAGAIELDFFQAYRLRQVRIAHDDGFESLTVEPIVEGWGSDQDQVPTHLDVEIASLDDDPPMVGTLELDPHGSENSLRIPIDGLGRWTPEHPRLHSLRVELRRHDRILDDWEGSFGLRHLKVVDGDFLLNGEHYPLHGSNVVHDWLRSPDWFHDRDGRLSAFYLDTARGMNARVLRTHTLPPIDRVAGICDRGGMLLLAEMPTTYNGTDYGFDAAEEATYRANALALQERWITALVNHPSIVGWVVINEPTMGDPRGLRHWQASVLEPAARALDPTREVLQAADVSQTISDIHNYSGFWGGAGGDFIERLDTHVELVDGRYALFNSEYIEGIWGREYRWVGPDQDHDEIWRIYAQIGHEQTDAMRVRRYDGILPYWLQAWTWEHDGEPYRPWAPLRMYAALRSSLNPCYAVVDRFDRHATPGTELSVPVHLVNDDRRERDLRVELFLLEEDPGHDPAEPAALGAEPITVLEETLPAGTAARRVQTVALPEDVGIFHLAAVTTVDGERVAISQRILRLVAPRLPESLAQRRIRILGAPDAVVDGLRDLGLDVAAHLPLERITADLVVIWEDADLDPHSETFGPWLDAWLAEGGSLLVMAQANWPDRGWGHVPRDPVTDRALTWTPTPSRHSTVHEVAEPLRRGLDRRHFLRWNGRAGVTTEADLSDTLFGSVPAMASPVGPVPFDSAAIRLGDADLLDHDFVVTTPRKPFTPEEATSPLRRLPLLESGRPLLLETDRSPGPAGYRARWSVELTAPLHGRLWAFEHGRRVASPIVWRIDDGDWQRLGSDAPSLGSVRLGQERVWFAWTDFGAVDLAAGHHVIEIMVDELAASGTYHLALDCLVLGPERADVVLARNGVREPVVVERSLGAGRLTVCQLTVSDRVIATDPHTDPAVRQFLFNLLDHAARD